MSDMLRLHMKFAATESLFRNAAHTVRSNGLLFCNAAYEVRSNGAIVVANYVSDKGSAAHTVRSNKFALWQCCSRSSQQQVRYLAVLLTKFAATSSLLGRAAYRASSNRFAGL